MIDSLGDAETHVRRNCDIIMKGGITSGIVYPAAVYEIAQKFVFKNVGGTSAGAIAAALTAAAERARARDGSPAGFERLNAVPKYLAEEQHLYKLFTPTASTRSLYRTIVSLFGRPRIKPAWLAKWCGLVWSYPVASAAGALAGLLFLALALSRRSQPAFVIIDIIAAAVTIVVGITVAIVIALARDVLGRLPRNNYGLVKGVDDVDRSSDVALCTWLTRELELTAGLPAGDAPLTFGMLWDARRPPDLTGLLERPADVDVNLEMITTNVTWGRPYQFPNDRLFFYDPVELKEYFPDHVVDWMVARPRNARSPEETQHFAFYKTQGKLPLPVAADLPVIVATRMSLAFPILLSAVPLYAADYSIPLSPPDAPGKLEQCWFSDGGISSNFPVTLFDSPLPRWPTFAINLDAFSASRPQSADESKNVYMTDTNAAGTRPTFYRFSGLPGFLSTVLNAMQNWNDNTQSHLPGYRDRIVTVLLNATEGGLNLDMPPDVLEKLRLRGAAAGKLIADRFVEPSLLPPVCGPLDWENHRWLRFRSTMGALRTYLSAFSATIQAPQAPDVTYYDLIRATAGTPVEHYPLPAADLKTIEELTKQIETDGTAIGDAASLTNNLPKPPPLLVQRASLDT